MEDKKPLYKSINPNAGSLINLEQAKLPPQALDLEEAVLEFQNRERRFGKTQEQIEC